MTTPPLAPISPFAFVWGFSRRVLSLGTIVLHATAIYWIHSDLHRNNPTWVSYMSFIPILDWIPMLDIAGLDRLWILAPAALFGTMAVAGPAMPPFLAGLLFFMPLLAIESWRNYHMLEHFEVASIASIALTVFRLNWITFSGLSILGTDRYQLVPHEQASLTEFGIQVAERLDQTVADPSIVEQQEYNLPLLVFHYIWKTFPSLSEYAQSVKAWNQEKPAEVSESPAAIEAAPITQEKH